MYVKMKCLCEEHFLIIWYSPFPLKFISWGMFREGLFCCAAFETDCSQCSSVPAELEIHFLIIAELWQF